MLKVKIEYDLPAYDPEKHDPDKTFAFLTYRGVNYAKWVNLKSLGIPFWKTNKQMGGIKPSFFITYFDLEFSFL